MRKLLLLLLLLPTIAFAQAGTTTQIRRGSSLPSTCGGGDIFIKSGTSSGFYFNIAAGPCSWLGPASTGGVASFNGRTGSVTPTSGDYTEAQISFSDITTNNSSTSNHGYLKKLDNNAAHYMDGSGNWSTPAGSANVHITFSATAGSSVTFTHNLASSGILFSCFDSSDNAIVPVTMVRTSSNVATGTFNVGAGYCNFNATGNAAGVAGLSGTLVVPITLPIAICQTTTATSGFSLPSSNAPTAACVTGSNTNLGVLQFPAGSTTSAQFHLALPADADCGQAVDVAIKWRAASTSNSVTWGAQTAFVADGSTIDPSFNTATTVAHAPQGTTLQLRTDTVTNITKTGCAAGSEMFIKIYRDGSDTMSGNAEMVGATLKYRRAL